MPPFLGGGEMIRDVRLDGFTTNELPWKFEAGTPPIAEIIGLGAAVDYLEAPRHGRGPPARGRAHRLRPAHPHRALRRRPHHPRPGRAGERGGVLSFAFEDVHPHDISQVLDQQGVCVRAGHHCAKPLMRVGIGATARASLYLYNDEADVDALADALESTAPTSSPSDPAELPRTTEMPGLEDLYREIILDHYRSPRNRGELPSAARPPGPRASTRCAATRSWCTSRPTAAGRRHPIGGQGCSISQSSASMMSAAVKGKTVEEAREPSPGRSRP
jgi:hypothetical protein